MASSTVAAGSVAPVASTVATRTMAADVAAAVGRTDEAAVGGEETNSWVVAGGGC